MNKITLGPVERLTVCYTAMGHRIQENKIILALPETPETPKNKMQQELWRALLNAHIFDVHVGENCLETAPNTNKILALPFSSCFIVLDGSNPIRYFSPQDSFGPLKSLTISSLLLTELTPTLYLVAVAMATVINADQYRALRMHPDYATTQQMLNIVETGLGIWAVDTVFQVAIDTTTPSTSSMATFITNILSILHGESHRFASIKTIKEIKFRIKKGMYVKKMSPIVLIRPKEDAKTMTHYGNKEIQWSHRFWVRGHWRREAESFMGKDRHGNRIVQGMTWVTEHIRGDDELPLVNKIYKVAKQEK